MSDQIAYDDTTIVGLLRSEVIARLGSSAWDTLIAGIGPPTSRRIPTGWPGRCAS